MVDILLISEDTVKTHSNLNDNVWGKNLLPAIREAQDIYLQQIIGTCLYKKLLNLVDNGDIAETEYAPYKDLLDDKIQDFLLYRTLANIIPILSPKLTNFGASISTDEKLVGISEKDMELLVNYYIDRANFYGRRIQTFLLAHRSTFPELDCCNCEGDIKPHLDDSARSPIWTGGFRGRRIRTGNCCD